VGSGTLIAGIRAEDLEINGGGQGFPLDVMVAEPLGAHTLLTGHFGQQRLRVVAPPDKDIRPGTRVNLSPVLSRLVWMDAESGHAIGGAA
jgi:multiple sugar transport system ATP-binding protein